MVVDVAIILGILNLIGRFFNVKWKRSNSQVLISRITGNSGTKTHLSGDLDHSICELPRNGRLLSVQRSIAALSPRSALLIPQADDDGCQHHYVLKLIIHELLFELGLTRIIRKSFV